MIATIAIVATTSPQLLAAYATANPEAINVAVQQLTRQSAGLSVGLIVGMVVGALFGVAIITVNFGAIATAALELGALVDDDEMGAAG
ncbi:hypothetical protein D3Y57_07135 [Sphingomonas paeninsulae]|uniref:Uncharacterized protein n=1 Tax=Sphingomonas paeninsulae TaxID=2319844 RepID=A0A494TJ38_SPHPE|nr:hypothetical protein [Sphingomonas paeninsulae]AYJ85791.1 hypothetical protein D3Y57_07135 [Sphingomonas paeninsulae]